MNPLGWKRAPELSLAQWDGYTALAAAAHADGLERTLVCGMGGSSLAPQVLAASTGGGSTALQVLDSTNPAAVRAAELAQDPARTLFLIVSKSGTTVETLAFYRYFAARRGIHPEQFIAITDPGTPLETLGRERGFRAIVPHPPDVGGRYAALTAVGMVPAALIGLDGRTLLERARRVDIARAQALGRAIADAAQAGRDKLVLDPPARVAALAHWIEQLVAESSGKDGRGVIPVVEDPTRVALPDAQTVGEGEFSADPLDLGAEFLRWEYATEAVCEQLGVNAFDQPDVEEAKRLARAELEGGSVQDGTRLATFTPADLRDQARPGDYVAILAYVPPTPDVVARLQRLRAVWGRTIGCATTLGIGPRYLHSTGQLHKGGPNTGLFLVITTDIGEDIEIPGMGGGHTFGALHHAQARGDVRALLARGRRVAHVHLASSVEIEQLRP